MRVSKYITIVKMVLTCFNNLSYINNLTRLEHEYSLTKWAWEEYKKHKGMTWKDLRCSKKLPILTFHALAHLSAVYQHSEQFRIGIRAWKYPALSFPSLSVTSKMKHKSSTTGKYVYKTYNYFYFKLIALSITIVRKANKKHAKITWSFSANESRVR